MSAVSPGALCDAVLEIVGLRADAEVTASVGRSGLTRFANSFIHQNVAEDHALVRLRLAEGGRQASGSTSRVDREGLTRLVDATMDAAQMRPIDPEWPGLAPPSAVAELERYDQQTQFADPSMRAGVVRDFVDAGDSLEAAGYCDTAGSVVCFANSDGQRAVGRFSRAGIDAVQRTQTSDGCGWQTAARVADLDGAAAGRQAAATARSASQTIDLEPGDYEVVLDPRCVADVVGYLSAYGFSAKAHAEGRSFVRIGESQLDASISLYDDATDTRALGLAFDAEGTPKLRVDLVESGVVAALLHDRRTAHAANTRSTGHAVVGGESFGPMASNLFLADGDGGSQEEMIAKVKRGLLVSDFWYTRIADPKTLVVTGLTRNGTFLIENGEIATAVSNLRFTQSYAEALAPGNVLGVGGDGRLTDSSTSVPSLHLGAWRFTGGASG